MSDTAPIIPMPTASAEGEPLVVRRRPGRPKKIRRRPDADQEAYERAVAEARREALDGDSLLGLLQSDRPDPAAVLHAVTLAAAKEQAALLWDRMRVEERSGDAQRISSRRIEALSKLATLVLQRRQVGLSEDDDPRSPQFAKVANLWVETISEAARDTLPSETSKLVLDRLMAAMTAWRASLDSLTS